MAALQYSFDWCKSLEQNMEQFRLHITKLTSYSLTCDTNEQVLGHPFAASCTVRAALIGYFTSIAPKNFRVESACQKQMEEHSKLSCNL